jgi:hypothetical protein
MTSHSQQQTELNRRMYERNIPSNYGVQPQFDPRPVATKYTHMHIFDTTTTGNNTQKNSNIFNVNQGFIPGSEAPWSGYASNIDVETKLLNNRNNYMASTNSDMYSAQVPVSNTVSQPFPNLFKISPILSTQKCIPKIGDELFNNSTRTQLRGGINKK